MRLPWVKRPHPVPRNFNLPKKGLQNALLKLEESKIKADDEKVLRD